MQDGLRRGLREFCRSCSMPLSRGARAGECEQGETSRDMWSCITSWMMRLCGSNPGGKLLLGRKLSCEASDQSTLAPSSWGRNIFTSTMRTGISITYSIIIHYRNIIIHIQAASTLVSTISANPNPHCVFDQSYPRGNAILRVRLCI